MEIVLDDVRKEHLGRAEEHEVRNRRRKQRSPQPDTLAYETEALNERFPMRHLERGGSARDVALGQSSPRATR